MKVSHYNIAIQDIGLSFVLAVAGCSPSATTEGSTKTKIPIQTGVAEVEDVPIHIRGTGHVTPFASVAIKSQVDGELERANNRHLAITP